MTALALLLDRPDDTIAHGNRALVRTEQLTWLTATDAPGFRGRRTIFRSAVGQLRDGLPALPFVPHPFPQHRQPDHPTVDHLRAMLSKPAGSHVPTLPIPRAYLSFDLAETDRVVAAVRSSFNNAASGFDDFRRAIGGGMLLRATGPVQYLGAGGDGDGGRLHWFRSSIDGQHRVVPLPPGSSVLVSAGATLEPDQLWARLPGSKAGLILGSPAGPDLPHHRGDQTAFALLLRLWTAQQVIRLPEEPSSILIPSDLAAPAARVTIPSGLWWDTRPFLHRYAWRWQSAVLPAWTVLPRRERRSNTPPMPSSENHDVRLPS